MRNPTKNKMNLIEKLKAAIAAAKNGTAMTVVSMDNQDDLYVNELWAVGDRQGVIQWLRIWLTRVA